MTLRIMLLNMLKLRRRPKRRHIPVQPPHPRVNSRIARADIADVALEVLDVDGVEADDGRVEADVDFREARAVVVGAWGGGEVGLDAVEGVEEGCYGGFVGGLRAARGLG